MLLQVKTLLHLTLGQISLLQRSTVGRGSQPELTFQANLMIAVLSTCVSRSTWEPCLGTHVSGAAVMHAMLHLGLTAGATSKKGVIKRGQGEGVASIARGEVASTSGDCGSVRAKCLH